MPISKKHNLIFVHIPKCAGTSIEKMLDMSSPISYFTRFGLNTTSLGKYGVEREKFDSDLQLELCAVKNLQHLTLIQLSRILDSDFFNSASIFTVVRNPYTRLVSEYEFCRSGKSRFNDTFAAKYETFDSFVESELILDASTEVLKQRVKLYDGHLETQASYLLNSENTLSDVDKMYRFESIGEAFEELKQFSPVSRAIEARKGEYDRKYSEYYANESTVNRVKQFYAQDFELFNYDPNTIPE